MNMLYLFLPAVTFLAADGAMMNAEEGEHALPLLAEAAGFQVPGGARAGPRHRPAPRTQTPQMLFGGGDGKEGDADFMSKVKQASQMFNPEMLQKYNEVGQKIQQVQVELQGTELEIDTPDGVVVTMTAVGVPVKVTVTDELAGSGAEKIGAAVSSALTTAHGKSIQYSQDKMREIYSELGIPMPGAEGPGAPPAMR